MAKRVLIGGSSGLLGSALAAALAADGHEVVRLVRRAPRDGSEVSWDPLSRRMEEVGRIEAAVHLSGAGIGDARWTAARRSELRSSRIDTGRLLAETLAALPDPPDVLLGGSAIGFYGDRGDEMLTEESTPGDGFLAQLCVDWEAAVSPAASAGIRVALLRTGLVLAGSGGLLAPMLPLFRLGLGGKIGKGNQWMSWIAVDDHVAAMRFLLDHDVTGPVNLVGPNPVSNAEFMKSLGAALGRPAVLTIPRLAIEARLGREAAAATAFASQRVAPAALHHAGFEFRNPELGKALAHVLG